MFAESLPRTHYTEREQSEIEAMNMGTESEARKRFQRGYSFNRGQSRDRSFSRDSIYNSRSRYDRFKSSGRQEDSARHD